MMKGHDIELFLKDTPDNTFNFNVKVDEKTDEAPLTGVYPNQRVANV